MKTHTYTFSSGWRRAALCLLMLLFCTGLPPGAAGNNEMAFTVTITPWGSDSFDFSLKNDSREHITGLTVQMDDGTGRKFAMLYAGSLYPSADVLEPWYVAGTNGLVREVWRNIWGASVGYLTGHWRYPDSPHTRNFMTGFVESPRRVTDFYGQRIHGFLVAPQTGTYTFWIASDDGGELWISTDTSQSDGNLQLIASVPFHTGWRQWNWYPQQSGTVSLVAGNLYYFRVLHKEHTGDDHVSIGWRLPNGTVQRPMPAHHFRISDGTNTLAITPSSPADASDTIRIVNIPGLSHGQTLSFKSRFNGAANAAKVLWNNGPTRQNAKITVYGIDGGRGELTLWDTASNLSGETYVFETEKRPRTLTVKSEVEGGGPFVSNFVVRVLDTQNPPQTVAEEENPPGAITIPHLADGMRVSIAAKGAVYLGAQNNFLYDSSSIPSNPDQVAGGPPKQRYVATGLSVNNTPQTGDPTEFSFDLDGDTEVKLRWRHDYALTINHNFNATESPERTETGEAWAGPLVSGASGNPTPDTTKTHWIPKGEEVIAQIDGKVIDFSRAGLDIRYVPTGYYAWGAARGVHDELPFYTNYFTVGQSPPQRQQVDTFTMYTWGSIEYVWQIQFGIRVNIDDPARAALTRVFRAAPSGAVSEEVGSLEGTFWFDPGDSIKVASAANVDGPTSRALNGWMSGDGFYFSMAGDIDSHDGSLISGGPRVESGSPVALWDQQFSHNGQSYRGLFIPSLRRPARVQWLYGDQVFRDTVRIGEYLFQHADALLAQYPMLAQEVRREPDRIQLISVTGANPQVSESDMAVWDPVALRLYPLVPGMFRAVWDTSGDSSLQVVVTALKPERPHYPHIAGTPPVQLTTDPNGTYFFKEIRYTENDAAITGGSLFTADSAGDTVLLFSEIKQIGRGDPKEYLRVRMVRTRNWNDPPEPGAAIDPTEPGTAIIGRAVSDPELDLAELGTGYLKFENARYNANIYDVEMLDGILARSIYDMTLLRSTAAEKRIVSREALPGPIIPVNLHPGARSDERIVVVWYYDPTLTDEILWPHAARTYLPRWPVNEAEGLGRIVVASQFGSDSVNAAGQNQLVAPAVTNVVPDGAGGWTTNVIPASTTYDPSRLQQPAVYVQNNPDRPGYNPNEEHALMAPSRRYAQVSPRPPAAYALRDNDLNRYNKASAGEQNQPVDYTSHPYVLVQFFDTAVGEFRMRVYRVEKEDPQIAGYYFANQTLVTIPAGAREVAATPETLAQQPYVRMEAGEPVIPFYPLGVVIGASPIPETFGINIKDQSVFWKDHKGTSWSVSGGSNAWFTFSIYYPLAPGFWWPAGKSGRVRYDEASGQKRAAVPLTGDGIAFMPANIQNLMNLAPDSVVSSSIETAARPNRLLYRSVWPRVAPVLKAGETLTFSGGEYRQDRPTTLVADDSGQLTTVPTPGLPAVLAFAVGEVVFDALNPRGMTNLLTQSWTVRMGQVLDVRSVVLPIGSFPTELLPASGRTRVSGGKYVFNDLPASLQKRLRYDPLAQTIDPDTGVVTGQLEISGILNDKRIGDSALTAPPPAVYVLEPNILTDEDVTAMVSLSPENTDWVNAVNALRQKTLNPEGLQDSTGQLRTGEYLVGLQPKVIRNPLTALPLLEPIEEGSDVLVPKTDPKIQEAARQFGPGLALIPNAGFLDPLGTIPNPGGGSTPFPDVSWVTVVENNDPSMGGSPVTLHVIKVDRRERYRGSIKTVLSDNVFDENVVLRHTGDFGANAGDLVFEWWYRPDDGALNVMPPYVVDPDSAGPWMFFPDLSGKQGLGRYEVLLRGNPNTPETLLADSWWFVRYRHKNDVAEDTDWNRRQLDGRERVNFEWAGAGNNDPFNDFSGDGYPDYRAQLSMGWIKRVLDAVNPYEARIRDFEGDSPATVSSMLQQLGPRFEGPVALNPAKDVIENVGLIELYQTILSRARALSIDLSTPVSTPAIANALQLAATRLADFYTLLGNEAYTDAKDPTIGIGSESVEYGALPPTVFSFQNQVSSLLEEELALLRGADDYFARPVYNRLFWNFTKGEGEAAYAMNYNITDINEDGFIDEHDAMILYPQGHGDAWGHYLTALRMTYDLLRHPDFAWVSRSEFYNLMDIVLKVDFLDERKFAQVAAAKARAGSDIVSVTYRQHYVEDPAAQWQGYTDVHRDRAWGVQDWARRAGQGAYFDWITANALLPSQHPNTTLEGIQKVDRESNADIRMVSAHLNRIQRTFDDANNGLNPLKLAANVVPFDVNPEFISDLIYGRSHFEQIYDRAVKALQNAHSVWEHANQSQNRLRQIANNEAEFRNQVFQQDLAYRNQLIEIFGRPYAGTVGPGRLYPAGYDGPDLALYMYVNVREISNRTVPGPTADFASFTDDVLTGGDVYDAYQGTGSKLSGVSEDLRRLFASTFAPDTSGAVPLLARDGFYSVNYTDLSDPKVPLDNLTQIMPLSASGYTFQAPSAWGARPAVGELQVVINEMMQQEAEIARAIAAWDALSGEIVRLMRVTNAKMTTSEEIRNRNAAWIRSKYIIGNIFKGIRGAVDILEATKNTVEYTLDATTHAIPTALPTVGLAVAPGDALAPVKGGVKFAGASVSLGIGTAEAVLRAVILAQEIALDIAEQEVNLANDAAERLQARRELLKELEDKVGDEPVLRIAIFKEIEALRALSDKYRSVLSKGSALIDERAAFNKRVAAMTQQNRYQDMTFRVHRNHALEVYHSAFDIAARYAYLAAKAYDYETNLDATDPGSPVDLFADIVRARTLGRVDDGEPQMGGGLAGALAQLSINYDALRGQMGFNNPQTETGKISLRTELFRILPSGSAQPVGEDGFPGGGQDSDLLWKQTLENARVANLWEVPEYRYYAKPFASDIDADGNAAVEPGIVLRFGTQIIAGRNVFGRPLGGGDHAYDPSLFATKIRSVGVWFSDYLTDDVLNHLPQAPRVYLFPAGSDIMSIANSPTPDKVRIWNLIDQQIPVPIPSVSSKLEESRYMPLLDSLNGRLGLPRRFSSFRAYHDSGSTLNLDEVVFNSRLVGRSVWNTEWVLIIPGLTLNSDPDEGLDRFIDQVKDIKLIFQTYGHPGT